MHIALNCACGVGSATAGNGGTVTGQVACIGSGHTAAARNDATWPNATAAASDGDDSCLSSGADCASAISDGCSPSRAGGVEIDAGDETANKM